MTNYIFDIDTAWIMLIRGFHIAINLSLFLYFIFINKKKAKFITTFGFCCLMIFFSTVVGTMLRINGYSTEDQILDQLLDMAIIPCFGAFSVSLFFQTKNWLFFIKGLFITELPIIACFIAFIFMPTRIVSSIASIYGLAIGIWLIIWTITESKKYEKRLLNSYSNTDNREIGWTRIAIFTMIGFLITYELIGEKVQGPLNSVAYFALSESYIMVVGYFIDKQKTVDSELLQATERTLNKEIEENTKTISNKQLRERLDNALEKNSLYLKRNITIKDVAKQIDCSIEQITDCLNNEYNKTFNQFINELRIKRACILMHENPGNSTEKIAFLVGFPSKVTFWRVFKVNKGFTPDQYKEMLNEEQATQEVLNAQETKSPANAEELTTEIPEAVGSEETSSKTKKRSNKKTNEHETILNDAIISNIASLTKREKVLFKLIAEGANTEEQCERMNLTPTSLRVTRSRLRQHLHLERKDSLQQFIASHKDYI